MLWHFLPDSDSDGLGNYGPYGRGLYVGSRRRSHRLHVDLELELCHRHVAPPCHRRVEELRYCGHLAPFAVYLRSDRRFIRGTTHPCASDMHIRHCTHIISRPNMHISRPNVTTHKPQLSLAHHERKASCMRLCHSLRAARTRLTCAPWESTACTMLSPTPIHIRQVGKRVCPQPN